MAKKTVQIDANLGDKFEIDLYARDFKMTIDQPEPGGTNKGPTPLEYLLFSLAGCFCSIARIIAMQRKIDLKGMEIRVEGDIGDKTKRIGFEDIRMHIKIDAPLTDVEKEDFIKEIDARCPVSDNLENTSSIEFVLEK